MKTAEIDTLDAITELTMSLGYAPSMRELAEHLGLSVSTIHARLTKLQHAGLVRWNPKQYRTLVRT